jgi:hypothetical protein
LNLSKPIDIRSEREDRIPVRLVKGLSPSANKPQFKEEGCMNISKILRSGNGIAGGICARREYKEVSCLKLSCMEKGVNV